VKIFITNTRTKETIEFNPLKRFPKQNPNQNTPNQVADKFIKRMDEIRKVMS
jgi:hypothetical protein